MTATSEDLRSLPVGTIAAETTYPVTPEAVVRYAGASGDFTAIHYDTSVARAAGYDRLFAMGMLSAGHLGALLEGLGGEVLSLSVRFRERSWLGEDVTCRAVVAAVSAEAVELDLTAVAAGRVITSGTAVVRV